MGIIAEMRPSCFITLLLFYSADDGMKNFCIKDVKISIGDASSFITLLLVYSADDDMKNVCIKDVKISIGDRVGVNSGIEWELSSIPVVRQPWWYTWTWSI